jgi:hypothetical protein
MDQEQSPSQEHLAELSEIRRATTIIAVTLLVSTLIVVGFFAPNGEVVWTLMIIAAFLWALVVGLGSTIRGISERRISARIDRERKAALSGRTFNMSPINK